MTKNVDTTGLEIEIGSLRHKDIKRGCWHMKLQDYNVIWDTPSENAQLLIQNDK